MPDFREFATVDLDRNLFASSQSTSFPLWAVSWQASFREHSTTWCWNLGCSSRAPSQTSVNTYRTCAHSFVILAFCSAQGVSRAKLSYTMMFTTFKHSRSPPPFPPRIYKEGYTIYGRTLRHLSSPFCGPRPTQFGRSPEGRRMSLQHVRWRCVALSAAVLYRIETKDLWPDYNQGELHWRTSLAYTSTFSHWMSLQPISSSLPFRPWKIIASTQKCEQLTFQLCGVRQRLGNDGSKTSIEAYAKIMQSLRPNGWHWHRKWM